MLRLLVQEGENVALIVGDETKPRSNDFPPKIKRKWVRTNVPNISRAAFLLVGSPSL